MFSCNRPNHENSFDFSNSLYNKYSLIVYVAAIYDTADRMVSQDTLGLFTSSNLCRDSLYNTQWQVICRKNDAYQLVDSKYYGVHEWTEVRKNALYLHPYRDLDYRILQFAPHPYFENRRIGETWEMDLEVGGIWNVENEVTIPANCLDSLKMTYKFIGHEKIVTAYGKVTCNKIDATCHSKFRQNIFATYYWCNKYGLVSYIILMPDHRRYRFKQIDISMNIADVTFNRQFIFGIRRNRKFNKKRENDSINIGKNGLFY